MVLPFIPGRDTGDGKSNFDGRGPGSLVERTSLGDSVDDCRKGLGETGINVLVCAVLRRNCAILATTARDRAVLLPPVLLML